jgi:hypothetical protein
MALRRRRRRRLLLLLLLLKLLLLQSYCQLQIRAAIIAQLVHTFMNRDH